MTRPIAAITELCPDFDAVRCWLSSAALPGAQILQRRSGQIPIPSDSRPNEWNSIVLTRLAMTNEERFIASCLAAGEADVRSKLNADRYAGLKAAWASSWLEQVENAKSDATKAEEKTTRLAKAKPSSHLGSMALGLLLVMLCAGAFLFLKIG